MSTRYTTALSHLVLLGTGAYFAASLGRKDLSFSHLCFAPILLNSLIGLWRYGNPCYGDNTNELYESTTALQEHFTLSSLTAHMLIHYGTTFELACIFPIISFLPFVILMKNGRRIQFIQVWTAISSLILTYVTLMNRNFFGIAASISYLFAYFFVKMESETYFDIPYLDLYNYALCFFTAFAYKTIVD